MRPFLLSSLCVMVVRRPGHGGHGQAGTDLGPRDTCTDQWKISTPGPTRPRRRPWLSWPGLAGDYALRSSSPTGPRDDTPSGYAHRRVGQDSVSDETSNFRFGAIFVHFCPGPGCAAPGMHKYDCALKYVGRINNTDPLTSSVNGIFEYKKW